MTAYQRVEVTVPGGVYEVIVDAGALDDVGSRVAATLGSRPCAVVTDAGVAPLYADRVTRSLATAGCPPTLYTVPAGEASKSWAQAGALLESFSDAGLGRDAAVVALGGGVVGDLAGFAAATYLRGIPVVQVPTTLLAQVDSSIGGKTGVDLPRGKNLAGAFWQPALVIADPECLGTLSEREWSSGLAEVVKSAILDSPAALADMEADADALVERAPDAVRRAVLMSIRLKARVVSGDERESADRECLNYGHTLAHALEREAGYGTLSHGAAVADGIRFAAALAERTSVAGAEWTLRQARLLDALGLDRTGAPCDASRLLDAMRSDKKARSGRVRFVMTSAPGRWVVLPVDERDLSDALDDWCGDGKGCAR